MSSLPFNLSYRDLAASVFADYWPIVAGFAAGVFVGALVTVKPMAGLYLFIAAWVAIFVGILLG